MEVRSLSFLNELNENVISKGSVNNVSGVTIRYYYTLIFNKKLKGNCSSCLVDAMVSMRKYYTTNISKYNSSDAEILKVNKYALTKALIEFKAQEKYELCEFIKDRIDIYKKMI